MEIDQRELRRQKILKNAQNRLDLLMGVKNSIEPSEDHNYPEARLASRENDSLKEITKIVGDGPTLANSKPQDPPQEKQERAPTPKAIKSFELNGHSRVELVVFFLMAFISCINIRYNVSYNNILVPFFSFEMIHFFIHTKYSPSTSSQFQMFTTLLRLCGISKNSLQNLMRFLNFLFILIDNFVIYLLSFVFLNICIYFIF